jgi:Fe-S cluster biogenesis protein NfuA
MALEEVRPYLQSHGGNVELLGVKEGVARLRMQGSCSGCPSSTVTLRLAIEEAIQKTAPDLEGIEAEGVAEEPKPAPTIVAGPTLRKKEKKRPQEDGASWTVVGGLPQLPSGGMFVKEVSDEPVLFLTVTSAPAAENRWRGLDCKRQYSLARGALAATTCAGPGDV